MFEQIGEWFLISKLHTYLLGWGEGGATEMRNSVYMLFFIAGVDTNLVVNMFEHGSKLPPHIWRKVSPIPTVST